MNMMQEVVEALSELIRNGHTDHTVIQVIKIQSYKVIQVIKIQSYKINNTV
jgi:hypothetical protein